MSDVVERARAALDPNVSYLSFRTAQHLIADLLAEVERLRQQRTIETVEELDATVLSGWGTLIMEIHSPNDGCTDPNCWVVPVVWEMVNQMGWMCHNPRRDDEVPHLPCRLLWLPEWGNA